MVNAWCIDCETRLSEEEFEMYEERCEDCERKWFNRVESWRRGGADPELDQIYDAVRRPHSLNN